MTDSSEIWVVDNASDDDSVASIRKNFPNINLVVNEVNKGFGVANNQAMAQAGGDFFLLLNSDAFPKPGSLRILIDYLVQHPLLGVIGPRLLNKDESIQASIRRFPSPEIVWKNFLLSTFLRRQLSITVESLHGNMNFSQNYVVGACLLLRRAVYKDIGGFDERFFFYYEEADWQKRMCNKGWQVGFTDTSEVTHWGGGSGKGQDIQDILNGYKGQDLFIAKHYGIVGMTFSRLAIIIECLLQILRWSVQLVLTRPSKKSYTRFALQMHSALLKQQFDFRYLFNVGKC